MTSLDIFLFGMEDKIFDLDGKSRFIERGFLFLKNLLFADTKWIFIHFQCGLVVFGELSENALFGFLICCI